MKNITIKLLICITSFFLLNCSTNNYIKRNGYTLKLSVSDTDYYQTEIKESKYILPENTIQIYPGETLFVEIELLDTKIMNMKVVKENLNPNNTLILKFSQNKIGNTHNLMMLYIKNPFNYKINYKANMCLMKNSEWSETTVVPVKAKYENFESWSDIITTLALSNWEFSK